MGSTENTSFSITLVENPGSGPGAITIPMAQLGSNPVVESIEASGAIVSRVITISRPDPNAFSVQVNRTRQNKELTDAVEITLHDQMPMEQKAKFLLTVRSELAEFEYPAETAKILGPSMAEFYAKREESLNRLEDTTRRLIDQNTEYRARVDAEIEHQRLQLLKEFDDREAARRAEYDKRSDDLNSRESALVDEKKKLDDRSNTHARRQLRTDLKAILKERNDAFALSAQTNKKRTPIHVLFIALSAGTAALAARAAWVASARPTTQSLIELGLTALSFVGALAFYIRWSDAWARQHANEEFKMRRLDLDVDRASWVVEVALEWNEEKDSQIPTELLGRLTTGLFEDGVPLERARHPAEDVLGTLLGASTAVEVNVPGGKMTLDRKGIKGVRDADKKD